MNKRTKITIVSSIIVLIVLAVILSLFLVLQYNNTQVILNPNFSNSELEDKLNEKGIAWEKQTVTVTGNPERIQEWVYKNDEKVSGYFMEQNGEELIVEIYIRPDTFREQNILKEINKNYIRAVFQNDQRFLELGKTKTNLEFVSVYNEVNNSGEYPIILK